MSDFVLIDLYSQREAFSRYTEGWSSIEIVIWMQHYGTVEKAYDEDSPVWQAYIDHFKAKPPQNKFVFHPSCNYSLLTPFEIEGDKIIIANYTWGFRPGV